MTYLFRAYSDQSQGINTPTLFAPGAATISPNLTSYTPPSRHSTSDLGTTLQKALAWSKAISSPFTFWTASLFFAVQVARSRKKKGEGNVRITALEAESARTPAGKRVTITPVPLMLAEYGIWLERANGEEKDYRDVFVTMDGVVPGPRSRSVEIEVLEAHGLYQLYPALNWAFERDDGRSRLNRNSETLRAFHFREEAQMLTEGRLEVAVGLAMRFVPAGAEVREVDWSILAHLLAFRKRSIVDPVLLQWIEASTAEVVKLEDDEDEGRELAAEEMLQAVDFEEVKQFHELWKLLKDRKMFSRAVVDLTASAVSPSEISAELANWKQWEYQQRQGHWAKKEARPDFDPNFKRRESRSLQSNPGSSSDSSGRNAAYAARKASKVWLPREEYVAKRDAHRALRDANRVKKGSRGARRDHHPTKIMASEGSLQPSGVDKTKRFGKAAFRRPR